VLHELEHLMLTDLARAAGTNRWFASTAGSREKAIRSVGADVKKLAKRGLSEGDITKMDPWLRGWGS